MDIQEIKPGIVFTIDNRAQFVVLSIDEKNTFAHVFQMSWRGPMGNQTTFTMHIKELKDLTIDYVMRPQEFQLYMNDDPIIYIAKGLYVTCQDIENKKKGLWLPKNELIHIVTVKGHYLYRSDDYFFYFEFQRFGVAGNVTYGPPLQKKEDCFTWFKERFINVCF